MAHAHQPFASNEPEAPALPALAAASRLAASISLVNMLSNTASLQPGTVAVLDELMELPWFRDMAKEAFAQVTRADAAATGARLHAVGALQHAPTAADAGEHVYVNPNGTGVDVERTLFNGQPPCTLLSVPHTHPLHTAGTARAATALMARTGTTDDEPEAQ